jgi:hypothetical protein
MTRTQAGSPLRASRRPVPELRSSWTNAALWGVDPSPSYARRPIISLVGASRRVASVPPDSSEPSGSTSFSIG